MNLIKLFTKMVAGGLLMTTLACATLINFDDLKAPVPLDKIPQPYYGLTFSVSPYNGIEATNATEPGVANGVVSGLNVFVSDPQLPSFQTPDILGVRAPFTLNSFYITAATNDGLTVSVRGTRGPSTMGEKIIVLETSGPTLVTFNWGSIDEFRFSVLNPGTMGSLENSTKIVLDNIDVTMSVEPEPSTSLTCVSGVLLLFWLGQRSAKGRNRNPQP